MSSDFFSHRKNWKNIESPAIQAIKGRGSKHELARVMLPQVKTPNASQMWTEGQSSIEDKNQLNGNISFNITTQDPARFYWRQGFSNRTRGNKGLGISVDAYRDSSLVGKLGHSNRSANNSKLADVSKEEQAEMDAEKEWVTGIEEWIKVHSGGNRS